MPYSTGFFLFLSKFEWKIQLNFVFFRGNHRKSSICSFIHSDLLENVDVFTIKACALIFSLLARNVVMKNVCNCLTNESYILFQVTTIHHLLNFFFSFDESSFYLCVSIFWIYLSRHFVASMWICSSIVLKNTHIQTVLPSKDNSQWCEKLLKKKTTTTSQQNVTTTQNRIDNGRINQILVNVPTSVIQFNIWHSQSKRAQQQQSQSTKK